jgi:hypothetical protein
MDTRETRDPPVRLGAVRRRFERWRHTRKRRLPIPGPLWAAAVKLVDRYGLCRTARTLRLDYYSLKKRVAAASAASISEVTCCKAVASDVLRAMDLECQRFESCPEVNAKACRMGLAIREVPIAYDPGNLEQGKKIRWTDGLGAPASLWRYRRWRHRRTAFRGPRDFGARRQAMADRL